MRGFRTLLPASNHPGLVPHDSHGWRAKGAVEDVSVSMHSRLGVGYFLPPFLFYPILATRGSLAHAVGHPRRRVLAPRPPPIIFAGSFRSHDRRSIIFLSKPKRIWEWEYLIIFQ